MIEGSLIQIEKLGKSYSGHDVLKDISLEIIKGEFISVLGASGCGKSTFLRLLADLENPSTGVIRKPKVSRTAFVFQEPALLPWRTVEENIILPFEILKEKPRDIDKVLSLVGLTSSRKLFPHELSGGMKMRTSIARALVTGPELLLMDEPFAALDEVTRFQLQDELQDIWRSMGMTILFVTHSISEAVYLSDRIFFLSKNQHQFKLTENIKLDRPRSQKLKSEPAYNAYVTRLAEIFRKDSSVL